MPVLKRLHWLPVKQRIQYKLTLLTFKCQNSMAPEYLTNLITPYVPTRTLRSQAQGLLTQPKCNLKVGERAFRFAAPKVWNELPQDLRLCTDF